MPYTEVQGCDSRSFTGCGSVGLSCLHSLAKKHMSSHTQKRETGGSRVQGQSVFMEHCARINNNNKTIQVMAFMAHTLSPSTWGGRQAALYEFEDSLVYIVDSRLAKTAW